METCVLSSKLQWKVLAIVLVLLVFGAVGVYPILAAGVGISAPSWLIDKQLKLGLDLKGGVHLVIRVETDYALRHESEQAMERLREELTKRGISGVRVTSSDITHFRVEGVLPTQDADFRQTAPEVQVKRSMRTIGQ
jgi:preprotein translocase subunit SecD